LALAGWILVQPPSIQKAGKLDISADAPLLDWEQVRTFATAAESEKDRQNSARRIEADALHMDLDDGRPNLSICEDGTR
jgi:hypothetical protein